ncbi:hypothetical protein C1H46_030482 [Malus baccata]|uniref:Uncharacterized protein n=1 Tax=Malus baccata TaxID=106549 RepID=A0A540LBS9_MALBA|nr:hypothetical protein C1H46_030482 [Malus baccata]
MGPIGMKKEWSVEESREKRGNRWEEDGRKRKNEETEKGEKGKKWWKEQKKEKKGKKRWKEEKKEKKGGKRKQYNRLSVFRESVAFTSLNIRILRNAMSKEPSVAFTSSTAQCYKKKTGEEEKH